LRDNKLGLNETYPRADGSHRRVPLARFLRSIDGESRQLPAANYPKGQGGGVS
jgi:hypothetical protein